jgi:hypothetical protein
MSRRRLRRLGLSARRDLEDLWELDAERRFARLRRTAGAVAGLVALYYAWGLVKWWW